MGLLLALGLLPLAAAPASPGAGGREFAPARITLSQRTFIRENLVTSALAKSVQGDVSARLGHKAAAEKSIAGPAKALAGLNAANYKRLRDAAQALVNALDAHAAKAPK